MTLIFGLPIEAKPDVTMYASTAWSNNYGLQLDTVRELKAGCPDSILKANADYEERQVRYNRARQLLRTLELDQVSKGDSVKVVRGRKVAKGTTGKVIGLTERVTHVSRFGTFKTIEVFALLDCGDSFQTVAVKHLDILNRSVDMLQELFDHAS